MSAHTVQFAKYIKEVTAAADPTTLQDDLIEPLAWQIAGDYLMIYDSPDNAKLAYDKVIEYYQNQSR